MIKALRLMLVSLLTMLCGTVMAESVTFAAGTNASACTVNGKDGIKAGTSNKAGNMTITVPANTVKLVLHAAAWRGVNGLNLSISGATANPESITLKADDGINNSSPFTLSGSEDEFKFEITLIGVTEETALTLSGTKRFVVWDASAELSGEVNPPAQTVAKPEFSPTGGSFMGSQQVTITAEEGAQIYYTLDGNVPTTESTQYTGAIELTETTTIKAIAVKDNEQSAVATATFTAIPTYATLASMAELANNSTFGFSGEAMVVAKPTAKYVYIMDATGPGLIYNSNGQKTAAAEVGKTIAAGWTGKVSIYNQLFELVPDAALVMKDGEAEEVTYPEAAAEDLTAENVNKVVTLKGITSWEIDGSNITFKVGDAEIIGYNQFGLTIQACEEGKTYKIVGAISRYRDNIQFLPISIEEHAFEAVDCTAKVDVNGWKSDIGSVGKYTKDVDQKEQYNGSTTTTLGEVLYQTVEGLDNGTYTVELYANASYTAGRGFTSAALNNELGRVVVYAGDVEKTIPVVHQTDVGTNNIVTLENVVVSDGTLKMGLRKNIEGSNWHTIQIKALTQTSNRTEADAAAQNEYWKEIAATVAAYEAYKNVAGVEKTAIAAAQTKATAQAAIASFYAAKPAYDALVDAITAAKAKELDVTDAEAVLAAAETTAEKAAEAMHSVKLAVNAKAVEGASDNNPIETTFVVNGTFDTNGNVTPWKATGGFQNQTTANNQQGAFTGNFYENWNPEAKVNKMYQQIEDIPNGKYTLRICAFVNNLDANTQFVFANSDHTALTSGDPTAYEVSTIVSNNKIEIGLEQTAAVANWMGIDNVVLVYKGAVSLTELTEAYNTALAAAQAVTGDMNTEVKAALDAAIAAEVDKTNGDQLTAATEALTNATTAAKASVAAYAKAAEVLPAMKAFAETTNLYTDEALNAYYTEWADKYEAKTLTTDEANALQDPNTITSWRAANTVDDLLMSVWDETPEQWDSYHVNTWSTEGNNDGSDFKVPFYEYWTQDGNSLAEKTMTATINDVKPGNYIVNAWVRVRTKNGAEGPANGITLTANDSEGANVCDGEQLTGTQFYLKQVSDTCEVGDDQVLTIKFQVAAENNISWFSFKNVVYQEVKEPLVELPAGVEATDWNLTGIYITETSDGVETNTKVARDGDDFYVQGLAYYFPESWIKGTLAEGKVTFAKNQFVGEDALGKEYLFGINKSYEICDIVFNYDAEAKTLTLDNMYIAEAGAKNDIDKVWGFWTTATLSEGAVTDEVVTAPANLKTEDYVFLSQEYIEGENGEVTYEPSSIDIKLGFDGNDVYVQGLNTLLPEAWVKGSKADDNYVFSAGQYFGKFTTEYQNVSYELAMYFTGFGPTNAAEDLVMTYDAATGTFATTQWLLINGYRSIIAPYGTYTQVEFKKASLVGIDDVTTTEHTLDGKVYNLNGQRLTKMQKGLNIVGGKKMFVK